MPSYTPGLTAITDLAAGTYNGYAGYLYDGSNSVPAGHNTAGLAAALVVKRNAAGAPAANGKIGVLFLGMSNARRVATELIPLATSKQDAVVLVNGCQTNRDAVFMVDNEATYYAEADDKLDDKGLTPEQVGVVWLYTAVAGPTGSYADHIADLKGYLKTIVLQIVDHYPNCKQIYLTTREYGGYSASGNPEEYAYASGFAYKQLVLDQVNHATTGDPDLDYAAVPWLGWTENLYTWANGLGSDEVEGGTPGRSDGLEYLSTDFDDGLHPSVVGATKIANLILPEFESGPYAAPWWYAALDPQIIASHKDTDGDATVTVPSYTPTTGQHQLIIISSRAGAAATAEQPVPTGHSATYALEEGITYPASNRNGLWVFRGIGTGNAGTLGITFNSQNQASVQVVVIETADLYTGGTAAALSIIESVPGSGIAVADLEIAGTTSTDVALMIAAFANNGAFAMNPQTGYDEIYDDSAGAANGLEIQTLVGYSSPAKAAKAAGGTFDVAGILVTLRLPPPRYLLEIAVTGGSGTVTSDPAGISCTSECDEEFYKDTEVTLTAVAATGYRFEDWTGDCDSEAGAECVVTMDAAKSITAVFSRIQSYAGSPQGLQLALLDAPGGRLLADFSPVATSLVITDGPHGFESLAADLELPLRPAARWYREQRALYGRVAYGPAIAWEGRLEDKALGAAGLRLGCFGYWRAFFDAPYTGLWSWAGTAGWTAVNSDNNGSYTPEAFEGDNNNRIFVAPRQDEDYDVFHQAGWTMSVPHGSVRPIVAVDFDFYFAGPADWVARLIEGDWDDYSPALTVYWSETSAGSPLAGTVSVVLSPTANRLVFAMYDSGITPTAYTGVTGASYLRITNLRIATTSRDRINTTLGTAVASPGVTAVTPASMAGIYVGQQLRIEQGGSPPGETVVVTAVTATTFTADFAYIHLSTDTVNAIVVYADEIAEGLLDFVDLTNPGQLDTSAVLIESHGRDLLNESFLDVLPADALTYLAGMGDANNERWEVGVREDRRLFFRPKGIAGRTWYVDATDLQLERSLDDLANSVYAVYQNGTGGQAMTRRTAVVEHDLSIEQSGLTRRAAVLSSTTSGTQAAAEAQAQLDYRSVPPPRLALQFGELFTAGGARVRQKWQAKTGDTFVLRNIDPTLLAGNDQVLSFRAGRVTYNAGNEQGGDSLTVEPESPAPSLVQLLVESSFVLNINPEAHGSGWGIPGPHIDPGHSGWGTPGPVIDPGHSGWGGGPGPIIVG